MKKSIEVITTVLFLSITISVFGDVGSFLKEAADTTSQISNVVNGPEKVSIDELKKSGSKFINKPVQVIGKVIILKSHQNGTYSVVICDVNGNKIKCISSNIPRVELDCKVKVTGTYNGKGIDISHIDDSGSIFG